MKPGRNCQPLGGPLAPARPNSGSWALGRAGGTRPAPRRHETRAETGRSSRPLTAAQIARGPPPSSARRFEVAAPEHLTRRRQQFVEHGAIGSAERSARPRAARTRADASRLSASERVASAARTCVSGATVAGPTCSGAGAARRRAAAAAGAGPWQRRATGGPPLRRREPPRVATEPRRQRRRDRDAPTMQDLPAHARENAAIDVRTRQEPALRIPGRRRVGRRASARLRRHAQFRERLTSVLLTQVARPRQVILGAVPGPWPPGARGTRCRRGSTSLARLENAFDLRGVAAALRSDAAPGSNDFACLLASCAAARPSRPRAATRGPAAAGRALVRGSGRGVWPIATRAPSRAPRVPSAGRRSRRAVAPAARRGRRRRVRAALHLQRDVDREHETSAISQCGACRSLALGSCCSPGRARGAADRLGGVPGARARVFERRARRPRRTRRARCFEVALLLRHANGAIGGVARRARRLQRHQRVAGAEFAPGLILPLACERPTLERLGLPDRARQRCSVARRRTSSVRSSAMRSSFGSAGCAQAPSKPVPAARNRHGAQPAVSHRRAKAGVGSEVTHGGLLGLPVPGGGAAARPGPGAGCCKVQSTRDRAQSQAVKQKPRNRLWGSTAAPGTPEPGRTRTGRDRVPRSGPALRRASSRDASLLDAVLLHAAVQGTARHSEQSRGLRLVARRPSRGPCRIRCASSFSRSMPPSGRSISSETVARTARLPACAQRAKCSRSSGSPRARIVARSTTLRSSRTLPGQSWARSAASRVGAELRMRVTQLAQEDTPPRAARPRAAPRAAALRSGTRSSGRRDLRGSGRRGSCPASCGWWRR